MQSAPQDQGGFLESQGKKRSARKVRPVFLVLTVGCAPLMKGRLGPLSQFIVDAAAPLLEAEPQKLKTTGEVPSGK
jgi:hypothetical protein